MTAVEEATKRVSSSLVHHGNCDEQAPLLGSSGGAAAAAAAATAAAESAFPLRYEYRSSGSSGSIGSSKQQLQELQYQQQQQQQRRRRTLPLSMSIMKSVAGMCCIECAAPTSSLSTSRMASRILRTNGAGGGDGTVETTSAAAAAAAAANQQGGTAGAAVGVGVGGVGDNTYYDYNYDFFDEGDGANDSYHYDWSALRHVSSAVSPLVFAPMMMMSTTRQTQQQPPNDTTNHEDDEAEGDSTAAGTGMGMPFRMTTTMSTAAAAAAGNTNMIERVISEYIAACRFYGCTQGADPGILTTFRFGIPSLRVSNPFHDAEMLALVEILLRYGNGPLSYIRRLDFSVSSKERNATNKKRGFQSHGAFTLSKLLQQSEYIQEVFLPRNRIGPYGASALFLACSTNRTLKRLLLRRCSVGERGALCFVEFVIPATITGACGLQEIDLSTNHIGFRGCIAIERALMERDKALQRLALAAAATTTKTQSTNKNNSNNNNKSAAKEEGQEDANAKQRVAATTKTTVPPPTIPLLVVNLEGNLVFQEIMNGVTHGLGVLLALLGASLLSKKVQGKSSRHVISCAVYSASLITLYTSSTLYHSFFSLQDTKYLFEVFDKSAIYILIAGSYTPFLQIVLGDERIWSVYLLGFLWMCCFFGIGVEAFFPAWEHRAYFSLAMYLGMGWCAVVCLPQITALLQKPVMNLLILGGVGYTAGVPFFIRNNNLDHAIWHLFVMAGSIFHWCAIYFYVSDVE